MERFKKNVEEVNDDSEYVQLMDYEDEKKMWEKTLVKMGKNEGLKQGKQEGLKQGKQEGLKQGIIETAKNMLLNNIDKSIIAKCTGLNMKELEQLEK